MPQDQNPVHSGENISLSNEREFNDKCCAAKTNCGHCSLYIATIHLSGRDSLSVCLCANSTSHAEEAVFPTACATMEISACTFLCHPFI